MAVKSHIITGFTIPFKPPASSSSSARSNSLCLVNKPLTSSFFNGGVTALKITSARTFPGRTHCHIHGGGALGTRMNLFARFARVVKSYANALLSSFEDPEKILDQAVLDMNDDLVKKRQATAQVLASQKLLENKYKATQEASENWYLKAKLALQKGEEDLAHEALKRRKSLADSANSLKAQLDQQKIVVNNLVSITRLLETKIQEANSKKDTLKARAQSASKLNEMVGGLNTGSALAVFEKMEEKVMAMEYEAEGIGQLTTDDLEGKFALLESTSVDDDLAQMKRELSCSSHSLDFCKHSASAKEYSLSSKLEPMSPPRYTEANEMTAFLIEELSPPEHKLSRNLESWLSSPEPLDYYMQWADPKYIPNYNLIESP